MKLVRWPAGIIILAITALAQPAASQAPSLETAEEIIDYVDRLLRGNSSQGTIVMDIVTENWSRSPGSGERPQE